MNIAILTSPYCKTATLTFFYFLFKRKKISIFIVESEIRTSFTDIQMKFIKNHTLLESYELNRKNISPQYIYSLILFYFVNKLTNLLNLFFWENIHTFEKIIGFSTIYTARHSSAKTVSSLKLNSISYALLTSSQWILTKKFLNSTDTTIINVHPGRLPKHRSLDSNPWALLQGETPYLSSHIIDSGIDTGPIIKKSEVKILDQDFLTFINLRYKWLNAREFFDSYQLLQNGCSLHDQKAIEGKHHYPMSFEELRQVSHVIRKFNPKNLKTY